MKKRNKLALLALTYVLASCAEAQDLDSNTSHKITAVERGGGELSFNWSSLPGARYRVDFTSDLTEWTPFCHGG